MARLQAEAKEQLASLLNGPSEDWTNDDAPLVGPAAELMAVHTKDSQHTRHSSLSFGRYHGVYSKHNGILCLNLNDMHFEVQRTGNSQWNLKYDEVKSLRKVANRSSNNPFSRTADSADEGILLIDMEGREYCVTGLKERDEVFTQIIGYSGVEWQITA